MPKTNRLQELAEAAEREWAMSFPRPELHLISVATDSIKRAHDFSEIYRLWRRNPMRPEQMHEDIAIGNEDGVKRVDALVKLATAIRMEHKLTIEAANAATQIALDRRRVQAQEVEAEVLAARDGENDFFHAAKEGVRAGSRDSIASMRGAPLADLNRVRKDVDAIKKEADEIVATIKGS